jgi:large repetitive protein
MTLSLLGKGTISGRMFADTNGDNTELNGTGGFEQGLAGQTVTLLIKPGTVVATTVTDAHGNYTFTNLKAAEYKVVFPTSVNGSHLVAKDVGNEGIDSDADRGTGKTPSIFLKHGQHKTDVDAGYTFTNTVTHPPANSAPHAVDDPGLSTTLGQPITVDVLANDRDPDGDPLTITSARLHDPSQGTVAIVDNRVVFTPSNESVNKTAEIFYTISDGRGGESSAKAFVFVRPTVDPRTSSVTGRMFRDTDGDETELAADGSFERGIPGQTIRLLDTNDNVIATTITNDNGDYRFDGLPAGTYVVQFPTTADGRPLITPNVGEGGFKNGFAGSTIDSDANQQTGKTAPFSVGIGQSRGEVEAGYNFSNSAPVANDDTGLSTTFGTPVTVDVLANDTDPDGDPLTISAVRLRDPAQGTVEIVGNRVVFTPGSSSINTTVEIIYTVSDGRGGEDSASAFVAVRPLVAPNSAPVAGDDSILGQAQGAITGSVLDNDTDADGDPMRVIGNTTPANGRLFIGPDGTFAYLPNPGFTGNDSFTYTVSDGKGGTDTATVTLKVNAAPAANDDPVLVQEGAPITGNVLDNDRDAEGNPLTIVGNTTPQNGTLLLNPDGSFTYTPNPGFTGTDGFTYEVSDGDGGRSSATVTFTVNAAPEANDDPLVVQTGALLSGNVLDNDRDAEGNPLTIVDNTTPQNGTLLLNPDGSFTYTPNPGFTGTDGFTYEVSDGDGGRSSATVTFTVNAAPVANDDPVLVQKDGTATGNLLANDSDPEGGPLTVVGNTNPANGSVFVRPDGTFAYIPNPGFTGNDSFTYTASDGNGGTSTATVAVRVNAPPSASSEEVITQQGQTITIDVLASDSDPDGDTLNIVSFTQPANGTVEKGSLIYTPNDGFFGTDSFTYTISDGNGGLSTATVVVVVNAAPSAEDDDVLGQINGPITVDVLANDTDPDGNPLQLTGVSTPANGTVTINPDGTLTYQPNPGFFGEETLTYTVADGSGGESTATVVFRVNAPPTAADDTVTGNTTSPIAPVLPISGNVLANDTDPNGDSLKVISFTQPGTGRVIVGENGDFIFDPQGFVGDTSFTYVVSDGRGGVSQATVNITVPCFAAGTLITTAEGLKRVEDIRAGDMVLTRDEGFQKVRWAGARVISVADMAANPDFIPVVIAAGALGNGLPRRDLRVSPGHRMLISGTHAELMFGERDVLVAAGDLVGQPGITQQAAEVTYVHIMFDTHQIIDAEGAWSESFQPADVTLNGLDQAQRRELLALFPELASKQGQEGYIAARRVLARHETNALLSL